MFFVFNKMENKTRTTRLSVVMCLMSLDEDLDKSDLTEGESNYENKKHNKLELLKQIEDIKTEDDYELMSFRTTLLDEFYEILYKDLTDKELYRYNYSELLFKNLMDINYFNKEYNNENLNDKSLLNEMLNILEERKRIIIYHLTNKNTEIQNFKTLNDYLKEYSMLYEKFMNTEKYDFEKHYKYKCRCEEELIKQYKQNDKLNYNDFYDIIESVEI